MTVSLDPMQTPPTAGPSREPDAKEAGQQLEAFFVRRMLAEMRKTVGEGMLSGGYAEKMFQDMLDEAMATDISEDGELGIADIMSAELDPSSADGSTEASETAALGSARGLARAYRSGGSDLRHSPVSARVSSDFGKRIHPVTGAKSFHEGIDLAAAKGTDVAVSGSGVVVRAGKAGSYGNIVVVDHGGGLETRYAHLDSMSVDVGQQVAAGEIVGKVGDSGRVTGAHLHFEVRRAGKAVDPKGEIDGLRKYQKNPQDMDRSADR
ncbi:MAG: peptidoglycan DD-metalloendopeptidase family protein [Myxococcales bacterium]|nr:peptidoglycan DD-metalloendopeptidase family protein [Myxococcales bacterium]